MNAIGGQQQQQDGGDQVASNSQDSNPYLQSALDAISKTGTDNSVALGGGDQSKSSGNPLLDLYRSQHPDQSAQTTQDQGTQPVQNQQTQMDNSSSAQAPTQSNNPLMNFYKSQEDVKKTQDTQPSAPANAQTLDSLKNIFSTATDKTSGAAAFYNAAKKAGVPDDQIEKAIAQYWNIDLDKAAKSNGDTYKPGWLLNQIYANMGDTNPNNMVSRQQETAVEQQGGWGNVVKLLGKGMNYLKGQGDRNYADFELGPLVRGTSYYLNQGADQLRPDGSYENTSSQTAMKYLPQVAASAIPVGEVATVAKLAPEATLLAKGVNLAQKGGNLAVQGAVTGGIQGAMEGEQAGSHDSLADTVNASTDSAKVGAIAAPVIGTTLAGAGKLGNALVQATIGKNNLAKAAAGTVQSQVNGMLGRLGLNSDATVSESIPALQKIASDATNPRQASAQRALNMLQEASTPGQQVQASYAAKGVTTRAQADTLYSQANDALAKTGDTVTPNQTYAALQNVKDDISNSLVNPANVGKKEMDDLLQSITTTDPSGKTVLNNLDPNDAIKASQQLNRIISNASNANSTVQPATLNALRSVQTGLQQDIQNMASKYPEAADALKKANDFYRTQVVPKYANPDTAKIAATPYADQAPDAFLNAASKDEAKTIYSSLDNVGQNAVRQSVVQNLLDSATSNGTKPLDIGQFKSQLANLKPQVDTAFQGTDKFLLDGLGKFAQQISDKTAQDQSNMLSKIGHYAPFAVGALATGATTHSYGASVVGGLAGGTLINAIRGAANWAIQSPDGRKLLLMLSGFKDPSSPAAQKVTKSLLNSYAQSVQQQSFWRNQAVGQASRQGGLPPMVDAAAQTLNPMTMGAPDQSSDVPQATGAPQQ